MKKLMTFSVVCLSGMVAIQAQNREEYLEKAAQPGANFHQITKEIEDGLQKKQSLKAAKGLSTAQSKSEKRAWKQYQRWKYNHSNYLNEDGTIPGSLQEFYAAGILDAQGKPVSKKSARNIQVVDPNDVYNANLWTNVGAQQLPDINGATNPPQMGRVSNFLRLNNATNADGHVLFAATPCGGIFKSTDNGATWVPKLDQLASIGATDMRGADDLTTANYIGRPIYLSTGDFDGYDTRSIGVLKSLDGGETFQATGLTFNSITQNRTTSNLIVIDDNTVIVGDNNGINRTTNGGTNWTRVQARQTTGTDDGIIGRFVRSGNNIMGTTRLGGIYYSTDLGLTWTKVRANDAGTSDSRRALAVNENGVFYALHTAPVFDPEANTTVTTGYLTVFNTRTNTFDNVGTAITGLDSQRGYNLSLLVDGNLVIAAGVDGFYSNDLGQTWYKSLPWNFNGDTTKGSYVHADHHAMGKISAGNYWDANDGGVSYIACTTQNYKTPTITYKTNGILNAMQYSVAINPTANTNDYIVGNQDNGSISNVNGTWYSVLMGDGIATAVNYLNTNIRYTSSYNTYFVRSNTGFLGQKNGQVYHTIDTTNGKGVFVFPFEMHKTTPTILYGGVKDVFRLSDNTALRTAAAITKTAMNAGFNGTDFIKGLTTHANTIIAHTTDTIRKTTNTNEANVVWATVPAPTNTSTNPATALTALTHVDFNQSNPDIIYILNSNATAGQKLYKTTNNGATWTNISTNLPNVGVNKVVLYQNQATEVLFVATNVGVYYKTNLSTNWFKLGTTLPNVKVTDIEINYNTNQLIASSYGRGLWRIDLRPASSLSTTVTEKPNVAFGVAPVPANNHIEVSVATDNNYQYQIYNAVGGIMQSGQLNSDHKIDTSNLPNAYYVLRVYNEKENYSKNIIIQH